MTTARPKRNTEATDLKKFLHTTIEDSYFSCLFNSFKDILVVGHTKKHLLFICRNYMHTVPLDTENAFPKALIVHLIVLFTNAVKALNPHICCLCWAVLGHKDFLELSPVSLVRPPQPESRCCFSHPVELGSTGAATYQPGL